MQKSEPPAADDAGLLAGLIRRLEARLEDIAGQQDNLAQTREQVLVGRERNEGARTEVHRQRILASKAEASLMDAFREHHNRLGTLLPQGLTSAYDAVDNARSKLVDLEDDYIRAQESLVALEWTLMDMESDLYQFHLQQLLAEEDTDMAVQHVAEKIPTPVPPSTIILPSLKVQYQVAVAKHDRLVRDFNAFRAGRTDLLDADEAQWPLEDVYELPLKASTEDLKIIDNVITPMIYCEVEVKRLKAELPSEEGPMISELRRNSDAGSVDCSRFEPTVIPPRAHSEGVIRHISSHLPNKHNVDYWLLESLKVSTVEQLRYDKILQHELDNVHVTCDSRQLQENAIRLWPSGMIDVLKWPGLATSMPNPLTNELQSKDDKVDSTSVLKNEDMREHGTHQESKTKPKTSVPKLEAQAFFSSPVSLVPPLHVIDDLVISHMSPWSGKERTHVRMDKGESLVCDIARTQDQNSPTEGQPNGDHGLLSPEPASAELLQPSARRDSAQEVGAAGSNHAMIPATDLAVHLDGPGHQNACNTFEGAPGANVNTRPPESTIIVVHRVPENEESTINVRARSDKDPELSYSNMNELNKPGSSAPSVAPADLSRYVRKTLVLILT